MRPHPPALRSDAPARVRRDKLPQSSVERVFERGQQLPVSRARETLHLFPSGHAILRGESPLVLLWAGTRQRDVKLNPTTPQPNRNLATRGFSQDPTGPWVTQTGHWQDATPGLVYSSNSGTRGKVSMLSEHERAGGANDGAAVRC